MISVCFPAGARVGSMVVQAAVHKNGSVGASPMAISLYCLSISATVPKMRWKAVLSMSVPFLNSGASFSA